MQASPVGRGGVRREGYEWAFEAGGEDGHVTVTWQSCDGHVIWLYTLHAFVYCHCAVHVTKFSVYQTIRLKVTMKATAPPPCVRPRPLLRALVQWC